MTSQADQLRKYTIGWIAPMPKELAAAISAVLGKGCEMIHVEGRTYRVGKIGEHHVVMTVPSGIGQLAARSTADAMVRSFEGIKHILVVGIAGGVPCYGPSHERQIALGDVVISSPGYGEGGIKHYDVGAITDKGFIESGHTNKPSESWLEAVHNLRTDHIARASAIPQFLKEMRKQIMTERQKFEDPGAAADRVFNDDYSHPFEDKNCETCCDLTKSRTREERGDDAKRNIDTPMIHYGTIGSGNSLLVSSHQRNDLCQRFGILCFEMESAGVADGHHCLVIRGVCDYADSHKNKRWQEYAALTAAACAREVLLFLPPGHASESRVMSTAGFSVTLFSLTSSAFEVLTTAASLGDDAGVLQAQLGIQEQLFRQWGHSLGLTKSEDELDERLKTETSLFKNVVAALSNIKRILLDVDELKEHYGIDAMDEIIDCGSLLLDLKATDILLDGEALLHKHERRLEDAEKTRKRISTLKKLRWAIKDKNKFEALISLLSKFNYDLYNLISPLEARMLPKAVAGAILRTTNIGRLLNIRIAAQGSNTNIAALARRRRHALVTTQTPSEVPNMKLFGGLSCLEIKFTAANGRRSLGTHRYPDQALSKPVIIEWKFVDSSVSGKEKDLLEHSVNNLAYFLQRDKNDPSFGTPRCLGTTGVVFESDEHKKYGLVYDLPDGVDSRELPVSLFEILPDNEDYSKHKEFDLGDKFHIAQVLSQSLYELLLSNWLHKSIRSDNISFFQPRSSLSTRTPRNISTGLVSLTGYEFARPGRLRDPTQKAGGITFDLYAHPSYRGGIVKYCRLFDIYSLGVVLLEIGLWRRIESGVGRDQTPESVRSILIQACCEELGPAMGKLYCDAVRCCLEGDFAVHGLTIDGNPEPNWEEMRSEEIVALEAKDEQVNGDLAESFYWKVVSPLAKLYAG